MLKMLLLKIVQRYELAPKEGCMERYKDESMGQYVSYIRLWRELIADLVIAVSDGS